MRRFLCPLAGMEISGAGPNLPCELLRSEGATGFPDPDLFDHVPIQVIDFLHLAFRFQMLCARFRAMEGCSLRRQASRVA